jgi:hypothetical protein
MDNPYRKAITLLLAFLLLLSACSSYTASEGPSIPGLAQTLAAQTLTAQQGGRLSAGKPVSPKSAAVNLSPPVFQPTGTPAPSSTPIPSLTPLANSLRAGTSLNTSENCVNAAEFIKDISIPDNTLMKCGARFIKTWQFKNIGTCTWTPDYALVFVWGNQMGGETPKPIGQAIAPGQFVEISTELQAPKQPGSYQGSWIFQDAEGVQFGTGPEAKQVFWVSIAAMSKLGQIFGTSLEGGCLKGG